MFCPKCSCDTRVIDSRPRHASQYRRHKCLSCSFKFNTYEIHESVYEGISKPKLSQLIINQIVKTLTKELLRHIKS
jgi:transcriptional regulator NrdR family protein